MTVLEVADIRGGLIALGLTDSPRSTAPDTD
jgi:hypothetical protein